MEERLLYNEPGQVLRFTWCAKPGTSTRLQAVSVQYARETYVSTILGRELTRSIRSLPAGGLPEMSTVPLMVRIQQPKAAYYLHSRDIRVNYEGSAPF